MVRLGILSLDHPHAAGNHIPALQYLRDKVCVTAIFHETRAAAQPYLDCFGAAYYSTRDALLQSGEVDAVLVTSKNFRHAEDCIAAANAKKDIFCDKPIATSAQDAARIRKAVEQNGVVFLTTYPVRFNDAVRELKQRVDAGELGEIRAIMGTNHGCMYEPGAPDWVKDPEQNGGGCLIDHCVHVGDIIRWLAGAEFETVEVHAKRALHADIAGEDVAMLHGTLTNGGLYQIDATWNRRAHDAPWGDVTLRIVGTKAAASLDIYNNQRVEVYRAEGGQAWFTHNIVREHGEIFLDYWSHKTHGTPLWGAGVQDGQRTVELAYAGYEALRTGASQSVREKSW